MLIKSKYCIGNSSSGFIRLVMLYRKNLDTIYNIKIKELDDKFDKYPIIHVK